MDEPNKRIESLDVLRGIAVMLVIGIHTSTFPGGSKWIHDFSEDFGAFGVQLFFIISGYTMMLTTRGVSRLDVLSFYIRRFFRIAPLFWMAEILYVLKSGLGHGTWTSSGIKWHDVLLVSTFTQFLSPSAFNAVVPGGWSISVEMQFYAVFPLLLWLFLKYGASTSVPYIIISLISVIARLIRAPFTDFLHANLSSNGVLLADVFQDWWLPHQLPCFGFGFLLFNWIEKGELSLIGLVALTLVALSSPWGITVFCLFLLAFMVLTTKMRIRFLSRVGEASYSIYLIHFAVIDVIRYVWALWSNAPMPQEAAFVLVVTISGALSLLIVRPLIEEPSTQLGKRVARSLKGS